MRAELKKFYRWLLDGGKQETLSSIPNLSVTDRKELLADLRKYNLSLLFYKHYSLQDQHSETVQYLVEQTRLDYNAEMGYDALNKQWLSRLLAEFGNDIILLKGLANQAIAGIGIYKKSVDVDLYVRPQALAAILSYLEKSGFQKRKGYFAYGQVPYSNGVISLDIHTILIVRAGLDRIFGLNKEDFFSYKYIQKIEYQSLQFTCFRDELYFIHLCLHLVLHHDLADPLLLFETKMILDKKISRLDPGFITDFCQNKNILPLVGSVLLLLYKITNAPQYKEFLSQIIKEKDIVEQWDLEFIYDAGPNSSFDHSGMKKRFINKFILNNPRRKLLFFQGWLSFHYKVVKWFVQYAVTSKDKAMAR